MDSDEEAVRSVRGLEGMVLAWLDKPVRRGILIEEDIVKYRPLTFERGLRRTPGSSKLAGAARRRSRDRRENRFARRPTSIVRLETIQLQLQIRAQALSSIDSVRM